MYYVLDYDIKNETRFFQAGITGVSPWNKYIYKYFFKRDAPPPPKEEMPPLPVDFTTSSSKKAPINDFVFPYDYNYRIISEKFYRILVKYNIPNMEFYPATITYRRTKETLNGYYAFNICGEDIAATDVKRSEYKLREFPGNDFLYKFTKLILDERLIPPERKVFTLANAELILVHEDIKRECDEEGVIAKFIPTDKWNYLER